MDQQPQGLQQAAGSCLLALVSHHEACRASGTPRHAATSQQGRSQSDLRTRASHAAPYNTTPLCAAACTARDDVAVITANPKTAGVARWIFLALWGAKLSKGKKAATKYVTKVRP